MGWLTRRFGLSIDNLVAAEVVTAAGDVLRVSDDEHPDLFWAIRGGGGNFGVVTSFEFRLHDVDPMVDLGMFFWPLEQGAEALRLARDVVAGMPADINAVVGAINAPPAPFVPEQHHFAPGYVLLLTGFGSARHADIVGDIRRRLPPLFDLVTPIPYVSLQQMLDEASAWGAYAYEKGTYVEDLSDDVIEILTANIPRKTSPMSMVLLYRLDGAYSEVGDDATAFSGGRSPRFDVFIIGVAPDAAGLAAEQLWVASFWEALRARRRGQRRRLCQRHERLPSGPGARQLRPAEVRAAGPDQGRVRPGQRVPRQREHRAGGPVARSVGRLPSVAQ